MRLERINTCNEPCPLASIPTRYASPPPSPPSGRTVHSYQRLSSLSPFNLWRPPHPLLKQHSHPRMASVNHNFFTHHLQYQVSECTYHWTMLHPVPMYEHGGSMLMRSMEIRWHFPTGSTTLCN